ncbi:alkaline phosphatase [Myroides sp. LJL119]
MKKVILSVALICNLWGFAQNKQSLLLHSHNDYKQEIPFFNAYTNGLRSIEIDLIDIDNNLYVAHEMETIDYSRTLEKLYLEPLKQVADLNLGQITDLQFLIDIKNSPENTMDLLVEKLKKYEDILIDYNIKFVISGKKPDLKYFLQTPNYIFIDYQSLDLIKDPLIWSKVAMVSLNFSDFSVWNGKGRLVEKEKEKIQQIVKKVHQSGKPIRFWGTPDGKTAWKAFYDLEIDIINTDNPFQIKTYFDNLSAYLYPESSIRSEIYKPSFKSDNKKTKINNVILLIGDGNGLTQISAAALANNGDLSLLQLKNMGLIKTQAADDFTTDSAAAATALSTGEKTYNRSIGMSQNREPLQNIAQYLHMHDFSTGVISTDEVVGATPSAFFAHQFDRDHSDLIAKDLVNSNLNLFIAGGSKYFSDLNIQENFTLLDSVQQVGKSNHDKVGVFLAPGGVDGVIQGRDDILARATKESIAFFTKKKKPFFLMIEAAKIDSYGHSNNTSGIVTEGIDFDKAISQALEFADKDGHTLVIITADHETGGFAIPQGNMKKGMIEGDFISNDHTGVMVPIFAYGPHSSEFQGVYENSEVYGKILKVLNLKNK